MSLQVTNGTEKKSEDCTLANIGHTHQASSVLNFHSMSIQQGLMTQLLASKLFLLQKPCACDRPGIK
ncbi:MAG: hypothetical protein FRX49_09627 [Trebouxia sp. A1-2]|nr:MAG: hypothetical protein FRX49_09627 [Trebouxia sp. A1-2]